MFDLTENKKVNNFIKELKSKPFIFHSDIDGLVSASVLYSKGYSVGGIYDLTNVFAKNKKSSKNFHNMIGIDLDMNYKDMHSLGHHIVYDFNPNSININNMINLPTNIDKTFTSKFPLNSVILIYCILGLKPKTLEEIALLLYCDSVIEVFDKYRDNCLRWLTILNQFEIQNALLNEREKIDEIIEKKIKLVTDKYNKGNKKYYQCFFTEGTKTVYIKKDMVRNLLKMIESLLQVDLSDFPLDFDEVTRFYSLKGENNSNLLEFDDYDMMEQLLSGISSNIVSLSIVNNKKIKVTTTIPYIYSKTNINGNKGIMISENLDPTTVPHINNHFKNRLEKNKKSKNVVIFTL